MLAPSTALAASLPKILPKIFLRQYRRELSGTNAYDTIVIGLGFAGVTAASTLVRAGKKVLAVEAQNRMGGRVRTEQFGDGIVEIGAECFLRYLNQSHPDILKDKKFINEFLFMINRVISVIGSTNDWNDVSSNMKYIDLPGHQMTSWHRNGYKTFFEILLNTFNIGPGLPNLDIKLNKEVPQIKWPKDSSGDVEVICKDGETFTADNVIVTVSLGVLKERYSTLFSPPLPKDKIEVIEKISFGVMCKTYLSFAEKWWDGQAFILFWSEEDKAAIDEDEKWLTNMYLVSSPTGSSNTLALWASGDRAKLIETIPEEILKMKAVKLLKMFLGKNFTVPEPNGIIRSTWYTNPFTRGSYSYDNLEMENYPNARTTLGEPLLDETGKLKVLFAGEATEPTHYSTVYGASDTGYREAMRILSDKL